MGAPKEVKEIAELIRELRGAKLTKEEAEEFRGAEEMSRVGMAREALDSLRSLAKSARAGGRSAGRPAPMPPEAGRVPETVPPPPAAYPPPPGAVPSPVRAMTPREMREQLRQLGQDRILAENAGDLRAVADLNRQIDTLSEVILRRSPWWMRSGARALQIIQKHPVASVFGSLAGLWALYSGKLTSFPAFIFEEAIQQAAFNLFGYTDRSTIERITDPDITSDADFEEWRKGATERLEILKQTNVAAKAYNESLAMDLAPMATPSYEAFVKTGEERAKAIQEIIDRAIATRNRRKKGEAVDAWDVIDSQKMVKAGFDPLIGLGMAIDALIKSRAWTDAATGRRQYELNLAIAEKAYKDHFGDLSEGWRAVYQGQIDAAKHRLVIWSRLIEIKGESPEEPGIPSALDEAARAAGLLPGQ